MNEGRTTTGWGFETATGVLLASGHETRKEAIEWIEQYAEQTWPEIKTGWKLKLVKIAIVRADALETKKALTDRVRRGLASVMQTATV